MDEPDDPFEPARPSRVRAVVAIILAVAVTVAFLAGTIGALLRGSGPDPTPPPQPGLLAVVSEGGVAPARIVAFPADGSAPMPIADGVAAFWRP